MPDIEKAADRAKQVANRVTSEDSPLTKPAGLAIAGAVLAAVPFAVGKLTRAGAPKLASKAGDLADQAKDKAKSQLADTAKDVVPDSPGELLGGGPLKRLFGDNDDNDDNDDGEGRAAPGYGSGRRMPIQQSVDVAVPVKVAYNHWTNYEDWPEFMHRIETAEQIDDTTVSFQAKLWGISKKFEAEIVEQQPDERIEWNVTQGYGHTGVVTFHQLSKHLTRIDVSLDVQPSNLIDKASRGMRFTKRAVRGDLHRFKAYVELDKEKKRGRRKTIEDGKVRRSRSGSGNGRSRGQSNGSDPKRAKSKAS